MTLPLARVLLEIATERRVRNLKRRPARVPGEIFTFTRFGGKRGVNSPGRYLARRTGRRSRQPNLRHLERTEVSRYVLAGWRPPQRSAGEETQGQCGWTEYNIRF